MVVKAILAENDGRREEAIEGFRAALEIEPWDGHVCMGLGMLLRRSGRKEEARELYVRGLAILPSDGTRRRATGELLISLGEEQRGHDEIWRAMVLEEMLS